MTLNVNLNVFNSFFIRTQFEQDFYLIFDSYKYQTRVHIKEPSLASNYTF